MKRELSILEYVYLMGSVGVFWLMIAIYLLTKYLPR